MKFSASVVALVCVASKGSGAKEGVVGGRSSFEPLDAVVGPIQISGKRDLNVDLFKTALEKYAVFEDPIVYGTDVMSVMRDHDSLTCHIKVQGSTTVEDWFHNILIGTEPIYSIKKCKTEGRKGCVRVGRGMKGFVGAFNKMRHLMWDQMQTKCNSTDTYVFSGHSRGGAIAQIASVVVYSEKLVPKEQIKLVTFGAPRAIKSRLSDRIHLKFEQWRLVNRKDPVPSLPYSFMGYKHFGSMVCHECNYETQRDAPGSELFTEPSDHFF
mmetsp:Transcript_3573/g.6857  ORF Transcript_3573/g.6857 Transcript_3573/m.6857 type:complete len:268 (+) Transcript_3573:160-963(+)